MAKCHRNNVRSLILELASTASSSSSGNNFRLWRSSFRRKLFDAVSCGGSSRYRPELQEEDFSDSRIASVDVKTNTIGAALNGVVFEGKQRKSGEEKKRHVRSEKLCDLLNLAEAEADVETRKKEEKLEELKCVVKELQAAAAARGADECGEGNSEVASKVRLLAKEDSEARVTLAMLGAIPPLVSLIDDSRIGDADAQIATLYALLNLGIGNDGNKAAIVKAGAVHKMLKLIESPDAPKPAIAEAVIANFLGLSALDSNKPIISSSGAIPFLVKTLKNLDDLCSAQAREDALRALYNLSIYQPGVSFILETDLIRFLLNTLGDMEVSERVLAILSNVVSIPEGRKAFSAEPDAFPVLVDVLNWTDSPGCQEKATYILMLMAHKGYGDRQAMIEAGIESSLLEITLLGSTLAQKRASRILECLRVDKGKQVSESLAGSCGAVSAPIYGISSSSLGSSRVTRDGMNTEEEDMMSEERKAVKQLVQQSLQNNMKRIVKRANLPQDFVPSEHFKSLTASSTSKSLPF